MLAYMPYMDPMGYRYSEHRGYLNINLCYECFRDVNVAWIRRYDRGKASVYLPWMLWRLGPTGRGAPGSPFLSAGSEKCDLTNKQ